MLAGEFLERPNAAPVSISRADVRSAALTRSNWAIHAGVPRRSPRDDSSKATAPRRRSPAALRSRGVQPEQPSTESSTAGGIGPPPSLVGHCAYVEYESATVGYVQMAEPRLIERHREANASFLFWLLSRHQTMPAFARQSTMDMFYRNAILAPRDR